MGKSKKGALVEPTPLLTASSSNKKKGKRGLEVTSIFVSSVKKSKTAEVPVPPPKKPVKSAVKKKVLMQGKVGKGDLQFKNVKPAASGSSEEVSDSEGKEKPATKIVKAAGKPVVKSLAKKFESSDEENEEESDEEPQIKKNKSARKASAKKVESSNEDHDSEESTEDDSDKEPVVKYKRAGKQKTSGQPAVKPSFMKAESSDEDSSEESEGEFDEEPQMKKQKAVTTASGSSEGGSKTIFVRNLDRSLDKDSVREFFQDAGEIKEVRLLHGSNQRLRGFGHIEFTTERAAKKACEKNGKPLGDREIFVELAKDRVFSPSSGGKQERTSLGDGGSSANGKKGGSRSGSDMTAFVKGFNKFQDEDSIRSGLQKFFSECGSVQSIKIPSDRETGQIKGFAYVYFSDKDALSKAVELNGSDFNGRDLFIEAAGQGGGGGGGRGGRGRGRRDFGRGGRGGRSRGRGGGTRGRR